MRQAVVLADEWPFVPPETVTWLLPELDSLADAMTAAILREVPDYGRPDDDSHARVVRPLAREAVKQFIMRSTDPVSSAATAAQTFHDVGRTEASAGRSLEALHTALRVGARVTWQRLRERTRQGGGDADVFARIGEAIFRYLDELAAASSSGYAEARIEFAEEAERLRCRLLDLLISEPPPSREAISALARAAGWRPPRRVSAVALAVTPDRIPRPHPPLPADALIAVNRREPCLLIPDPEGPGRLQLLEAGLRKWPMPANAENPAGAKPIAAVGPAVPLAQAGASLRWARRALALTRRGLSCDAGGILHCDEHLAALVLLADAELADIMGAKVLAPLRRLRPEQADRLSETLLAWLESADNAGVAARRLHVHPQTVRYRLRQLTDLFGERLSDPEARFSLQVALRARPWSPSPSGSRPRLARALLVNHIRRLISKTK
jgi:hypothetical protein